MSVNFTHEQLNVIGIKDADVLVSAAAGSGKTAVLVERIIRKILDDDEPLNIDRLLVVTFTEAAASSMRQRIGDAIRKALEESPDNEHLQRQSTLLYKAQISTIHSFCLNVIRNNFDIIGLDPAFSIADETELDMLSEDVLNELFEDKYESGDSGFAECVDYFCNAADDKALKELVLRLTDMSEGSAWPDEWLNAIKGSDDTYLVYLMKQARQRLKDALDLAQRALLTVRIPGGPTGYEKNILSDIDIINEMIACKSYEELHDLYAGGLTLQRLSSKAGDEVDEDARNTVKTYRDEYKEILFGSKTGSIRPYFENSIEEEKNMEGLIRPYLCALIDLAGEFIKRFRQAKNDKNIISYSDMEHYALDILYTTNENGEHVPSLTAKAYRDAFDEIMMDEYQDCNRVQELLMLAVSSEYEGRPNRFMVGDIKQSIYKFRLASPELFLEKYKSYEMYDPESQSHGSHCRIDLHSNFRSRKNVVNTVNDLFGQIMHEKLGDVEYDETAVLNYMAGYPEKESIPGAEKYPPEAFDYSTQVLFADKNNAGDHDPDMLEAEMIAQRIKELKQSLAVIDDRDKKTVRPLKYSDIVILLRSMTDVAQSLRTVLIREGIPCYISLKTGFYEAKEIQDVIHMLRVIDNPLQETALFGAMVSYFGGFDDEDIAKIRIEGQGADLYRQMRSLKDKDKKTADFLSLIERYRRIAEYTPIHELINMLIGDTGYLEYVGAMAGGQRRKANLHMLVEKASVYEKSSYKGLFNFVRYLSKIKDTEADMGEADVTDENADVVRIMTIHKSKGLEFPVCFLAGVHKQFNRSDTKGDLVLDMVLGAGVPYIDQKRRIKINTLRKKVCALKLKNDMLGEELRVLYVAMTRAEEKLIITGTVDGEKFLKDTGKERSLFDAVSYYDMLYPMYESAKLVGADDIEAKELEEGVRKLDLAGELRKLMSECDKNDPECIRLRQRFDRKYPYSGLEGLILKTSVSELKKAYLDMEMTAELFKDRNEEKRVESVYSVSEKTETDKPHALSGTDRGSAYHKVMELLDFTDNDIKSQINKFKNNGLILKEWGDAVSVDKIERFLSSDIGRRMAKAQQNGTLRREQPFMLGIDANRVQSSWPSNETVLLQGIIDAFFIEDGQIVLLDYKTDVIKNGEELMHRYSIQLDYYEEALNRILEMPVKESVLYSFCLGEAISRPAR